MVGLDAARTRYALEHAHHLVRRERHLVEVVPVELDGHVAANARDQFVETKLDRLADFIKLAELAASGFLDTLDDIGLRIDTCRPLILGFQDHETVGDVRRHRVGRHLGRTRLRKHQLDFGQARDRRLDVALHDQRLFEAHRRHARRGKRHILLVELRNEFRAEQSERRDRKDEEGKAAGDESPRLGERLVEQGQVALLRLADRPDFLLGNLAANHQRDKRRNQGDRENEGRNEREHDGDGHRREGLPLDARKHQQRREGQ